jgi:hypothetical protein
VDLSVIGGGGDERDDDVCCTGEEQGDSQLSDLWHSSYTIDPLPQLAGADGLLAVFRSERVELL